MNPEKDILNIVPKLLNFFVWGFDSVWRNFNPIWYNELGFETVQIGLLRSLKLVGIIFGPIWSILADKTRKRKLILSVLLILSLLTLKILDHFKFLQSSFYYVLLVITIYSIFWVGLRPITEGLILSYLDKEKILFGRQVVFGALGWLGACVIAGYLYTSYGFYACWYLQLIFVIAAILVLYVLFPNDNYYFLSHSNKRKIEISFYQKVIKIFKNLKSLKVIKILIVLTVQGAGSNMIQSFLFVYLKTELNTPEYILGWTIFFTCLFELPIFFYSHIIIKKMGINTIFIIGQLAFIIRTFLYGLLNENNILWILPMELLHGLTYANMWTSATEFASEFCPKGLESVCMLILSFCYNYLGAFIGNFVGGLLFKYYGAIFMFHFFGILSSCFCFLFIIASLYEFYTKNKQDTLKKVLFNEKDGSLIEKFN